MRDLCTENSDIVRLPNKIVADWLRVATQLAMKIHELNIFYRLFSDKVRAFYDVSVQDSTS